VRSAADDGAGVVHTTHYLPELDVLDATVAVADHGRIVARGSRAELLATVAGRAVLGFGGAVPTFDLSSYEKGQIHVDSDHLTITSRDSAAMLASLLSVNPELSRSLRSIELEPPSLDDLYRHLVTHEDD